MSPERKEHTISLDEVISNAKEMTLKDGHHTPILIVEGSKNLIVSQFQEISETHGERIELMRFAGQAVAKSGRVGKLEQVFFISEGWMSVAKEDKPPNMKSSDDPNRKEVLIISGLQIKERKRTIKLFEMVRDQNDHVVSLPEISPPQAREDKVEVPLLDAFAQGFQLAFLARVN